MLKGKGKDSHYLTIQSTQMTFLLPQMNQQYWRWRTLTAWPSGWGMGQIPTPCLQPLSQLSPPMSPTSGEWADPCSPDGLHLIRQAPPCHVWNLDGEKSGPLDSFFLNPVPFFFPGCLSHLSPAKAGACSQVIEYLQAQRNHKAAQPSFEPVDLISVTLLLLLLVSPLCGSP